MPATTVQGFESFASTLQLPRDARSVRQRLIVLERILEGVIRLPFNQRVGLDGFIGLVPVVGDLISASIGSYLVWEARNLGLSKWQLWRMGANVAFDTAIGAVPLLGDAFDFFFRSNSRNLKILRKHLDKHHPASGIIEG